MILQDLSRKDLVAYLKRKSRKQLTEELLNLHGQLTTRRTPALGANEVTSFEVPVGTARAMAHLADANTRRRLKKQDPSLFTREPTPVELAAGKAAVWQQYKAMDIKSQDGVEKRRSFRRTFASVFNNQDQ